MTTRGKGQWSAFNPFIVFHQAHCWNAESGCDFVGPVRRMLDHYYNECGFHVVFCSCCRRMVRQSGVEEHRETNCSNPLTPEQGEDQESRRVPRATKGLEPTSTDNINLQTTCNELLEGVRSATSCIRQCLSPLAVSAMKDYAEKAAGILAHREELRRMLNETKMDIVDTLKGEINAASERAAASSARVEVLVRSLSRSRSFHWYLKNWSKLKADTLLGRSVDVDSDSTYVEGYKMFLNVQLEKEGSHVHFGLFLGIGSGNWDSILEWPFRKKYTLSIVHLNDPSKTISKTVDLVTEAEPAWANRPVSSPTIGCGRGKMCTSDMIDRQGLVVNDTLHLRVEIDPQVSTGDYPRREENMFLLFE